MMGVDVLGGDQEMNTSLCPLSVLKFTGAPRSKGNIEKNESDYTVGSNTVIIGK